MTKQGGDNKTQVQTTVGVGCNHKSGRGQEATTDKIKDKQASRKTWETILHRMTQIKHGWQI